ncbi:MAG: Uma2 family endonuclease [Saprospiraceae bacterium]|nr:Uma2 family endonuclease [Saprospiraceae bacterium]
MVAIAEQSKIKDLSPMKDGAKQPKQISWEEFERRYLSREDSFKYEWVNGIVVKTKRTMDFTQFYIVKNLQAFFRDLLAKKKVHGELITEGDTFFLENHRRPDIAWFTDEQIALAKNGIKPMPQFIIEIISKKDQANLVEEKMDDYRAAGVKVVWQVFPKFEKIHVYTGENLDSMTVCQGDRLCSAAPALSDFVMAAKEVFK